jgi:glycosyltransferase involved in cell wall biosynthesis
MSFALHDRANMEISFPSKLTDYSATGLPILIWGPPYCSAVKWAKENPGVAEVVEELSMERLAQAVARLAANPSHRIELGANALEKGREYFSHEIVTRKFYQTIIQPTVTPASHNHLRAQQI